MKLYDVPNNSRIKVGDTELDFEHIDGMYSLCYTDSGDIVHIKAYAEVEVIERVEDDTELLPLASNKDGCLCPNCLGQINIEQPKKGDIIKCVHCPHTTLIE